MQAVKADRTSVPPNSISKFISIAIILTILIVVALYINNAFRAFQAASLPQGTVVISQGILEEKYGVRVNLIAVTAAGGLVDVRLKFVDAEKAKSLLQDPKNFPTLWIAESSRTLNVPEDTKAQEIKFENDGNLFLMFPNASDVVKPGTPVTITFGNIQVEPILAR